MPNDAPPTAPVYKRILLKLSGEALMGKLDFGISPDVMRFVAHEIKQVVDAGVQVAVVVGGGNIFRGEGLAQGGMDRVTGDQMGMLATVINALAIRMPLSVWISKCVCSPPFASMKSVKTSFVAVQ